MNADNAVSRNLPRQWVSPAFYSRGFVIDRVAIFPFILVPTGTIHSKPLVPHGTRTTQNVKGAPNGKTSSGYVRGRRQARQDRAAHIRNAARARNSGARFRPQDRRTLRASSRARR